MTDLAQVDASPDAEADRDPRALGNTRAAAPVLGVRSLQDHMGAYDALPAALRGALGAAVVAWSPVQALVQWRRLAGVYGPAAATQALLGVIARNEVAELERFAQVYLEDTGWALPHTAAGATPQRPGWGMKRPPTPCPSLRPLPPAVERRLERARRVQSHTRVV